MKKIIVTTYFKLKWLFYNLFSKKTYVRINTLKISLPRFHKLPLFMDLYPLYDKFLFYLVRDLEQYEFIDVGANIGDTAAQVFSSGNPPNSALLIEPNPRFSFFAEINNKFLSTKKNGFIKIINSPISSSRKISDFVANATSATQDLSKSKVDAISIDNLVKENLIIKKKLLIKIDIDGYDWDAIISAKEVISKYNP